MTTDEELMRLALEEAKQAVVHGDVPIGALVVAGGEVIARRHNERELLGDPTAHAEILAIKDAAQSLGSWRLDGCTVVATIEPCVMCAGALVASRVARLVFGAADLKAGAGGSLYNVLADPRLNHEVQITRDIAADSCGELVSSYFADRRAAKLTEKSGPK